MSTIEFVQNYDDLSTETLARFEDAHVRAVEPGALRAALAASVVALMHEGAEARLPHAHVVAQRLDELIDAPHVRGSKPT